MPRKPKPSLFDRLIGFVTATPADTVAKRRKHFEITQETPPPPKPSKIPTASTFSNVPPTKAREFEVATATMRDLEWIIMNPQQPQEIRRAAAERWAATAPRPLRPHIPSLSGVGHDPFWRAFRDAYKEQELW